MANITLNIEGDLNIYVSEEDGQPDSLYLDGMDGFPETLRIHLEADGEDDESKAEVIYAIPGAAAISMTLYEALTLALNSGGADSLELMPVSGIFIAFNSDDVIIDQSGDCYRTACDFGGRCIFADSCVTYRDADNNGEHTGAILSGKCRGWRCAESCTERKLLGCAQVRRWYIQNGAVSVCRAADCNKHSHGAD